MDQIKRAFIRLLRIGAAGALSAIGLNFAKVDLAPVIVLSTTAVINGLWKYLRQRYPDYWLWKLM